MMGKPYRQLLLPLLSAGLLAASLLHANLSWLVFVGLIPLIHFIVTATVSSRRLVLAVWAFGFLYMLVATTWMLQVNPENWTALKGADKKLNQYFVWLLSSLIFSVGFLLAGLVAALLRQKKLPVVWLCACLVAVIPLSELVRSYAYSLASYGPGALVGPQWNFGSFGLGAMSTPLGYASRLSGLYGLSALVVVLNAGMYLVLTNKRRIGVAALLAVGFLAVVGYVPYRLKGEHSITVGLVHLGVHEDSPRLAELAQGRELDLLVAPEYAYFSFGYQQAEINELLKPAGTFITSMPSNGVYPPFVQTIYYSPTGGVYNVQQKRFLIPTGEFMPYVMTGFARLAGQESWIRSFNSERQVQRAAKPEIPVTSPDGTTYGTLSCSGILAPEQFRRLTRQGANVLVSPASIRLLSGSSLYKKQAREMARFHAVANYRPFIEAARGDESHVLDANGRQVLRLTNGTQLGSVPIVPASRRTPYTLFGEAFIAITTLGVLVVIRKKA